MGGQRTAGLGTVPTVDVVVVAWNQGAWLDRCIRAIARQRPRACALARIIVVDNASATPIRDLSQASSEVTMLTNPVNRGFAAACNQAAALSCADYVLFVNPDTELGADALDRAVAEAEAPGNADVGILGLRLIDEAGTTHRTSGRFPRVGAFINQLLGLTTVAPALFPGIRSTEWPHDHTCDVDYVSAAALLVRRPLFTDLGGFDERLFLYLEDMDLALRARRAGWRTRFCAEATVEHAVGWISGGNRHWRLAQSWRSRIVYGWTHLSSTSALTLTGAVIVCAPIARLAQAGVRLSPAFAVDAVRAWLLLWVLLAQSALTRRRVSSLPLRTAAPEAQAPPPASPT